MAIQINTALVEQAATAIAHENDALRDAYEEIDKAIASLRANWSGNASDACCRKADYIKTNFKNARHAVVADYIRFLNLQVGSGYELTEKTISSAADAFK